MEHDPSHGPEYVPLPSAARPSAAGGEARADPLSDSRLPRVPNADPSPAKLLAIVGGTLAAGAVAFALAGGALYHFAAGLASPRAAAVVVPAVAAPALTAPAPERLAIPVEDRPTSPLLGGDRFGSPPPSDPPAPAVEARAAAAAAVVPPPKPALPEPPVSATPSYVPDASQAIAAQASSLSAAETASLFSRASGGFSVSNPGAGPAGALGAAAAAAPGACPACANALNASGTARVAAGPRLVVGLIEYIGPCQGGYVYRIVNQSAITLPNALVADDGQVWRIGSLAPGQSLEIRSKTMIHRTTSVNLP